MGLHKPFPWGKDISKNRQKGKKIFFDSELNVVMGEGQYKDKHEGNMFSDEK
jgi:hypothetical protein